MKKDYAKEIRRINYLASEMDSLYHQASVKFGMSDSVSIILYMLYDTGGECLLSYIYKNSGISKQTINSAIRNLEAENKLYLKQYNGRAKQVVLTDEGKLYASKTVARLFQAEVDAFETWSEEEIETYLHLMGKYTNCLREQVEKL